MKPIFLDTETTGILPEDRLCQVAYKCDGEMRCELFAPPLPIKIEAMAVHHITPKMIEGKPAFEGSAYQTELAELLTSDDAVMVAHNAAFDVGMLRLEGVKPRNVICTLKVARHLDTEGAIPKFGLQYLRYYLDLDVEATAHDAAGDVLVLERLFERLHERMQGSTSASGDGILKEMIDISARPSLLRRIHFGKHAGKRLDDLIHEDRGYLEWLLTQKKQQPYGEDDWIYTLEHYLAR